jgi:hypothetical protein
MLSDNFLVFEFSHGLWLRLTDEVSKALVGYVFTGKPENQKYYSDRGEILKTRYNATSSSLVIIYIK